MAPIIGFIKEKQPGLISSYYSFDFSPKGGTYHGVIWLLPVINLFLAYLSSFLARVPLWAWSVGAKQ